MTKQILKPLIIILQFMVVGSLPACKKSGKECPLQPYNIECTVSSWDPFLGRYDTGTSQGVIQANCPEDARKITEKMSYGSGQSYKRCRLIP